MNPFAIFLIYLGGVIQGVVFTLIITKLNK